MAAGLYNVLKGIYNLEELDIHQNSSDDVSNLPCPILS